MAVILNLVIDALLGRRQANLCFHFAGSGDPEDYMKRFLQTLVIEIAEVHLETTFPTSSPRITSVQYCGGCSVLRRLFSTAGGWHQYCRGMASVLRRLFSTAGGCISTAEVSISTAEAVQYCGGIASVLRRDSISTVEG